MAVLCESKGESGVVVGCFVGLFDILLLSLEATLLLHPGETQVLLDISLAALVVNTITQWTKTTFSPVASLSHRFLLIDRSSASQIQKPMLRNEL